MVAFRTSSSKNQFLSLVKNLYVFLYVTGHIMSNQAVSAMAEHFCFGTAGYQ